MKLINNINHNMKNQAGIFRFSLCYLLLFAVILGIEILIGAFASGFLRNYIGDVLVMPAMYCLLRTFTGRFPRSLPGLLLLLACFVEFLQSIRLYQILGFEKNSLPAILLGTKGDLRDILCYLAGTVLILASMIIADKIKK